jgi:fumarate reductase flavoprotein subunit
MFKRIVPLLLIAVLAMAMIGCGGGDAAGQADREITPMEPGTYTETVEGMYEGMVVEVTLSEKEIEKVEVIEHSETQGVSDAALEQIPEKIVEAQSVSVDTISGATYTSEGIITAVRKAIEEAGGKVAEFELSETSEAAAATTERPGYGATDLPDEWDMSYDVVVIGGGFAGLAATHTAAENGASVVLVEKMPFVGGNSQINGGVYASYTSPVAAKFQEKLDVPADTAEQHIEDTIKGGDYLSDRALVENFVYGAPYYMEILLENGLELRESLTRPGGHYGYRTYTTLSGSGSDIVQVQKKIVDETDATIMTDTEMTRIYRETEGEGRVVGIRVQTEEGVKNIEATQAVILCTGGFSGDVEMRSRYVPTLTASIPTTNHVGATGEGIKIAQAIGADTLHMSYIQLYPFANPNNGVLDPYAVIPFSGPSAGVVYVDKNGERYVNEGERRDVCSRAAQETGGPSTFTIMGEKIVREGGFISETQLKSGIEADRIFKAETLEDLVAIINDHTYQGETINMSAETLEETIETHNEYVARGEDPDFGKVIDKGIMMKIEHGPYYAIPQWPSVHHTMGGLKITPRTEVQDIWGETIPGLFAAGEVVGGIHGTNRLGSNAVVDCVSHGVIAGQFAVTGTLPEFVPADSSDL